MSLVDSLLQVSAKVTRRIHGESIVLKNAVGDVSATIPDAIVSIDNGGAGDIGSGPATETGVLRLAENYRTAATASLTATVRGREWNIVHVGDVVGGLFRAEIRRNESEADSKHSNLFDLDGTQAVWSDEE